MHVDSESKQTIVSGMGELHLEIYVERMKREYKVECTTGKPQVAFREAVMQRANFDYTHKKQSGGSGQFARIKGYIEPISPDEIEEGDVQAKELEFDDQTVGMNIPSGYIPAIHKGFKEAARQGPLVGHPVESLRVVLLDGAAHAVDSSEMAFAIAARNAFKQAFLSASPIVLEPVMDVTVTTPSEYQGAVIGLINKRKGAIVDSDVQDDYLTVQASVPLNDMFGFSTDLRSCSQGKGEFAMSYVNHARVMPNVQDKLVKEYRELLEAQRK